MIPCTFAPDNGFTVAGLEKTIDAGGLTANVAAMSTSDTRVSHTTVMDRKSWAALVQLFHAL